jgi:hypothetical protein
MPRPARTTETAPTTPLIIDMHDFRPDPDQNGTHCSCGLPRQNRHHHDAFMGPAPHFPHTPSHITTTPW